METNKNILKKALANLPDYEPLEHIWAGINQELNEEPLKNALKNLSQDEPDELLWELIKNKSALHQRPGVAWWYVAAMILLGSAIGMWMSREKYPQSVSYTKEVVDLRLQANKEQDTDHQYQKLKTYCETETLVCDSKDFNRLKQEYETLRTAAEQLQQAMGEYNTEPELMRQFSMVEQEKAEVLNQMAKMI
jgi:exonuclease VII large subunit